MLLNNDISLTNNYIYTKLLDLDVEEIKKSSYDMRNKLYQKFKVDTDTSPNQAMLSSIFQKYNLLMYPYKGFHDLYTEIAKLFHEINDDRSHQYYMQCWVNFYHKGQFIDWHQHRNKSAKAWHGFYCVDCEPSHTSYKLEDGNIVDIHSKNNLLVISKSGGDVHRTWPWQGDTPRITIAFDIVPQFKLDPNTCPIDYTNHWIPV